MQLTEFENRAREATNTLWRVSYSILRSGADADDALQEALIRAWRARESLKTSEYFETWLTRILINECKRVLKARSKRLETELKEETPSPEWEHADTADALSRLNARERVPLLLNVYGGYELTEVARMLKTPYSVIYRRVKRAKALLRDALEKEDSNP